MGDLVERLIRAAQPFADSVVIDTTKQRGDRHWATFGKPTNIDDIIELRAALAALTQGSGSNALVSTGENGLIEALTKLEGLRKLCESCGQPFYVEILDEVLTALANQRSDKS